MPGLQVSGFCCGGSRTTASPPPPQESPYEDRCEPPAEDDGRDDSRRHDLEDGERGIPGPLHDLSRVPGRLRWRRTRGGLEVQRDLGLGAALIQLLYPT